MNVLGIPAHTDQEALANFIEGLRVAESACAQLALYTQQREWFLVRLNLEGVRETAVKMAQASLAGGFR